MLTLFGRKKLSDDQVANIFVNSIIRMIDEGFEEVAGFIKDSPEFVQRPEISRSYEGQFSLIVIAGNLALLPEYLDPDREHILKDLALEKFAAIYDMDKVHFADLISKTNKFMAQKNHPSKNVLYAMSKGLFCKYRLNEFQEAFFRDLEAPNPIFLKQLNQVLSNFLWDWKAFTEKYKFA